MIHNSSQSLTHFTYLKEAASRPFLIQRINSSPMESSARCTLPFIWLPVLRASTSVICTFVWPKVRLLPPPPLSSSRHIEKRRRFSRICFLLSSHKKFAFDCCYRRKRCQCQCPQSDNQHNPIAVPQLPPPTSPPSPSHDLSHSLCSLSAATSCRFIAIATTANMERIKRPTHGHKNYATLCVQVAAGKFYAFYLGLCRRQQQQK